MIRALRFQNYQVLRNAELPLRPFTVLVGPNGSGKSTVMRVLSALGAAAQGKSVDLRGVLSVGAEQNVSLQVDWEGSEDGAVLALAWLPPRSLTDVLQSHSQLRSFLERVRVYALDEKAIVSPVQLQPHVELAGDGANLAGVLDRIRDQSPEAFEALNVKIGTVLPEFDRILFYTPAMGQRAFGLRTRDGHHFMRASELSRGTVLALTILTLSHVPDPPTMICLEEPDRGIHPRLFRELQDALYRLAYPQSYGLDRDPVQVLITTHSPYLLDLHREHPEEVVIAQRNGMSATFHKLSDREDIEELLSEASLGELWYSGVLGGVPVNR
jgi:predicted ATPase